MGYATMRRQVDSCAEFVVELCHSPALRGVRSVLRAMVSASVSGGGMHHVEVFYHFFSASSSTSHVCIVVVL